MTEKNFYFVFINMDPNVRYRLTRFYRMTKFRNLVSKLARKAKMRSVASAAAGLRARRPRSVAAVAQYVSDRGKEMKAKGVYSGVNNYNAAASVAGDIVEVTPAITTGDGETNRDGRLIKMHKHVIKGCVAVTGTYYQPNVYVDVWLVEDKWIKNPLQRDASTAFLVLKNNSQVPTNPGNSTFWSEIGYGLNRDRFIIRRKRIKLAWNYAPANTASGTTDPTVSLMRTFSFTRNYKKGRTLHYQSDADTMPYDYNTYMFFSVGSYDENYYGTITTQTVKASVNSTLYFKEK